jgi:hypothetical protein
MSNNNSRVVEAGVGSEVAVAAAKKVAVGEEEAATLGGASGGIGKRMTNVRGVHEVRQVRAEKRVVRLLLRWVQFGRRVVVDGVDGILIQMRSSINGTMAGVAVRRCVTSASL